MTRPGAVRHACPDITRAPEEAMPIETTKCALCQTAVFRAGFLWEVDSGEQHTPLRCRAFRAANGEGGR